GVYSFLFISQMKYVPLHSFFTTKNIINMQNISSAFGTEDALKQLGLQPTSNGTSTGSNWFSSGEEIPSYSPVDGKLIASVKTTTQEDYQKVMNSATEAFTTWRLTPAPQRGEVVRQFGEELRKL